MPNDLVSTINTSAPLVGIYIGSSSSSGRFCG